MGAGHEYTVSNARFARALEPHNLTLRAYHSTLLVPSVPSLLAVELACNPFLRVAERSARLRPALGLAEAATDVHTFAALRARKDAF